MSLNVALNVALSGLFANQTAIAATSENIANVNTENFSARDVRFTADALPDQFAGVSADVSRRAADRFLQETNFTARGRLSEATIRSDALGNVEASLGRLDQDISYASRLDQAFSALVAVSANPQSVATKADALARLDDTFAAFGRTLDAIDTELSSASSSLEIGIERVNGTLETIFRLNQIASSSDGAKDQIDAALASLSDDLAFSVARAEDGTVSVALSDGTVIADNTGFVTFGFDPNISPAVISAARTDGVTGNASALTGDISASLGDGALGGLVGLINTDLPDLFSLVDGVMREVVGELNAAYILNTISGQATPTTDVLIVESNGRFAVNADIRANPDQFAVARPTTGATAGTTDGSGAAALAAIGSNPSVLAVQESIAQIGVQARNASIDAATNEAIVSDVNLRLANGSGINLDEELSNLIIFQQSYSANARVIATVDELWETLLSVL
ncbi:MAG: flagellar hook-associated protein FlgK [Pseudomonadota bacterium]